MVPCPPAADQCPGSEPGTRWQVVSAETLLERLSAQQVRRVWPLLARWEKPATHRRPQDELIEIASWVDRKNRAERLLESPSVARSPQELDEDRRSAGSQG